MPTLRESIEAKYEILERIGQGGMGAVYKVRHRLLDQERAVKVIRSPVEPTPEAQERFLREARTASRLRHPNLAVLHDYAVADDGNAWLVLEWIDGITLREALRRHGPPPLALSLEVARQTSEALAYLHRQRIVHRDVSPGNLMVTRDFDGRPLVKLIDLGLAKALEGSGEGMTTGGLFVGKLRYASPEQFGTEGVDARSDLYSLGVVLYEMLTGWCPVEGHDPMSWMAGHLFRPPLAFAGSDPEGRVPEELRELILRLLAKKPDERPGSAEELAEALRGVQARYPLEGDDLADLFGASPASVLPLLPPMDEPESSVSLVLHHPGRQDETFEALPLFAAAASAEMESASLPLQRVKEADSESRGWLAAEEPLDFEEPDLLGTRQPADRAWGGLAAASLLLVALLGTFLWYQRPAANSDPSTPPSFAPPAAPEIARAPVVEEPDAPPPPEPEIIEEMPAEEPEPTPEPERVQIADVQEPPQRAEVVPVVAEARPVPVPARRPVPSGPPAERMAGALRPGPGVEMPVPLELPAVRFPSAARGQGIRVDVHLDLLVDEQGRVIEALVREGDTADLGFNEAAVNAALRTRFQPATRWDLPGKAWTELIIEFEEPRLAAEPGR